MTANCGTLALGFFFSSPSSFKLFLWGWLVCTSYFPLAHRLLFFPTSFACKGLNHAKPGVFKVSLQGNGVDLRFFTSEWTDHVGSSFGKSSSYSYSNPYQNPSARGHNIPKWPHFYDQIKVVCVTWNSIMKSKTVFFYLFHTFIRK